MGGVPYEFVQGGGYFGPTFTSVFLFQSIFWRMVIPIVYGRVRVNILDCLIAMPVQIRQHLMQHDSSRRACMLHWADCIDYDQGMHEFLMRPPAHPAAELVRALDRDVRSTISDLAQEQPNSNAMHDARIATEKALKAHLCFHHGYTIEQLKKQFGHDVAVLAADVAARSPKSEFTAVKSMVGVFAPYRDRYAEVAYSREDLWAAYSCAQFTASSLMRSLTSYNQRTVMVAMLNESRT